MSQNTPGTSVYHDTAHGTVRVAPVADRPILFSAPMVRALLEGRKTQTRLVAQRPTDHFHADYTVPVIMDGRAYWTGRSGSRRPIPRCHAVGDRLWVRETHIIYNAHGQSRSDDLRWGPWGGLPTIVSADKTAIAYFKEGFDRCGPGRWRPSTNMPRWASRLTLVVTDVRVQRLHDISDEDAREEGMPHSDGAPGPMGPTRMIVEARSEFEHQWRRDHGPGSWEANPFVSAYSFTVHHCNIDTMPAPTAAAAE